jgi:hypothetical protein
VGDEKLAAVVEVERRERFSFRVSFQKNEK